MFDVRNKAFSEVMAVRMGCTNRLNLISNRENPEYQWYGK